MTRVVISVNLSLADAEEYEEAIASTRREYNILNKDGKRCSKGKALMYLVRLGRTEYSKIINRRYEDVVARKKQIEVGSE
jgi:hypothetical protein